jgi:hypothetical protein
MQDKYSSADDPLDVIFSKKDELRRWLIRYIEQYLAEGGGELNCATVESGSAACCQAVNNLIQDVSSGADPNAGAQRVMASCFGIG